jgi:hypothetical protein
MVTADAAASYFLKVAYQAAGDAYVLDLNRPQSGFLRPSTMRDFVVEVETVSDEDVRRVHVELDSASQKLYLFARQCTAAANCGFFDDRVVRGNLPGGEAVQKNLQSTGHKELDVELHCGKKNSFQTTRVSHKISLYKCVLNVGVFSNEAATNESRGVAFTLRAQDRSMHHMVPVGEWSLHRLAAGEQVALQAIVLKVEAVPYKSVTFTFDSHYGQTDLFLSKKNRHPCDEKDLISHLTVLHNEQKTVTVNRSLTGDNKIRGNYYICLKSHGISSVSVLVQADLSATAFGTNPALAAAPKLLPHGQVLGQVMQPTDILYFTIDADFEQDEREVIRVHVTPISGTFRIFAATRGVMPTPGQAYWNVVGTTLEIKPADRRYLEKGRYVVGVQLADPAAGLRGQSNKFLISFEASDKHTLLRQGLPYVGKVSSLKGVHYFQVHFRKDAGRVTLFKSQLQAGVYALVAFDLTASYPTFQNKAAVLQPYFSSLTLDKQMWQKACPSDGPAATCSMFVTIGSARGDAHYSLSYSVDGSPVTLPHDFVFGLPILQAGDPPLHFVYHVDKERTATVDVRPAIQHFQYLVKWEKEQSDAAKYDFPQPTSGPELVAKGRTDSVHEFVVANSEAAKKDENEVLLISLYPVDASGGKDAKARPAEVTAATNGYLEVSTGHRTLIEGRHVTATCVAGEWKYFRLHHPYTTEDLTVNVEMVSGAAQVFVSRGFDRPPSEDHYLARRWDVQEASVRVTSDDLPPGTSLSGGYMLGVRCLSSTASFQASYQPAHAKWLTVQLGFPVTHRIPANEYTFIELPSGDEDGDIVLTYYSRYAHLTLLVIPRVFNASADPDAPQVFPGPENYNWKSTQEGASAGFGRLTIRKTDEGYCRLCTYVIRVETSEQDKVEFSAVKKNGREFVRLLEGSMYLGDLRRGENDSYVMVVPPNETYFSINLRVLKGNVSLHYGVDPLFRDPLRTHTVAEKTKNQFFTIDFGKASSYLREVTHTSLHRFIRLEALADDSQYTFQVAADGLVTELTTMDVQQAVVAAGMTHYYYFPTAANETVDLFFHLRYILDRDAPDFAAVVASLPRLIKVYQAESLAEVHSKAYSYEAAADVSLYKHEVQVAVRAKQGFVVAAVTGHSAKAFSFTLELAKQATKRLAAGVDRPDHVDRQAANAYIIDPRDDNDEAEIHIDMCLNSITADYSINSKKETSAKNRNVSRETSSGGKMVLVNNMFMRNTIPMGEYGFVNISVKKASPEDYSESDPETEKYPAIYNIYHNIVSAGDEADDRQSGFVVGDIKNYGEVEAFADDDQSIKFEGLNFHKDFLNNHKEYSMLVNYTLYMSLDKRMVHFMKYCDYYRIDQAAAAFKTNFFTSYSVQEYVSDVLTERKHSPIFSIKPHSFSFGGTYHGVVVAEVRLWPKTVSSP